jgi:hypothetical protein
MDIQEIIKEIYDMRGGFASKWEGIIFENKMVMLEQELSKQNAVILSKSCDQLSTCNGGKEYCNKFNDCADYKKQNTCESTPFDKCPIIESLLKKRKESDV